MALARMLPISILSFSYSFSYHRTFYSGYSSAASIISHFLIPVLLLCYTDIQSVRFQYFFHQQLPLLLPSSSSESTKSSSLGTSKWFSFLRDENLSFLSKGFYVEWKMLSNKYSYRHLYNLLILYSYHVLTITIIIK